jgi:hypothetical protein
MDTRLKIVSEIGMHISVHEHAIYMLVTRPFDPPRFSQTARQRKKAVCLKMFHLERDPPPPKKN